MCRSQTRQVFPMLFRCFINGFTSLELTGFDAFDWLDVLLPNPSGLPNGLSTVLHFKAQNMILLSY